MPPNQTNDVLVTLGTWKQCYEKGQEPQPHLPITTLLHQGGSLAPCQPPTLWCQGQGALNTPNQPAEDSLL